MPSVFIRHASEDKDAIARPLAAALLEAHIEVWFDEFSMQVGDSLREAIDRGLAQSDFGIVIVSPAFFAKSWPQRELNGLVAREMAVMRRLVLPVWHEADVDLILRHSPPLADIFAAQSSAGISAVVTQLLRTIRPVESPLSIARAHLARFGVDTPSLTDDWWLDVAEMKQSIFAHPECAQRWIFPLPFASESNSAQRGLNIASTALQLHWCHEAELRNLCQLTNPDELHCFIRAAPGMMEIVRQSPGTLALYAPQLTLPEFDDGLEDVFDALLSTHQDDAHAMPGYGGWGTSDGEPPACGELIAWRHPTFGGFTNRHLGCSFVDCHNGRYSRRSHSTFTCLVWLLSNRSNWLPDRIKAPLLDGIGARGLWVHDLLGTSNPLIDAMLKHGRKSFQATRTVRASAEDFIASALNQLQIDESAATVANRFFERRFIDAWYAEEEAIAAARRRR
jgi:hypothetical protein